MIDAVAGVSRELQQLKSDLSFAAFIVESTRVAQPMLQRYYQPFSIPHSTQEYMRTTYKLTHTGARAYLILHGSVLNDRALYDLEIAKDILANGYNSQSALWDLCANLPDVPVDRPPCYAVRSVNSCLHTHTLWHSLHCLLDTRHISINPDFLEYNDASDQIRTTVCFWSDVMDKRGHHSARATHH